jgi:uncharacterized membrane protein
MTIDPLLAAPASIKLHVSAIAVALLLAPVQLALPKGTRRHRLFGWLWVGALGLVCLSAFAILDRPVPPRLGPLSWLHLLALFTLVILWRAVRAAQRHDVASHRAGMTYLTLLGLGVPLIFAVAAPGRIVARMLFTQ